MYDDIDEEEITRMKRAFMKKLLFWLLFVPWCIVILVSMLSAYAFNTIEDAVYRSSKAFENWCFDTAEEPPKEGFGR